MPVRIIRPANSARTANVRAFVDLASARLREALA